jgi:type IV secretory pathway VirB3-like protein
MVSVIYQLLVTAGAYFERFFWNAAVLNPGQLKKRTLIPQERIASF